MPSVTLRASDLAAIRGHARAQAPREACGALVGRREGDATLVERVLATTNVHAEPRAQYTIAPDELLRAAMAAERDGLDLVGFYHSHPAGPPHPSATDASRASWPDAAHLLVWLAPEEGVGCWTWREARRAFEPTRIVVQ
jgi:proteasome lid subunit RPN8/RPN11